MNIQILLISISFMVFNNESFLRPLSHSANQTQLINFKEKSDKIRNWALSKVKSADNSEDQKISKKLIGVIISLENNEMYFNGKNLKLGEPLVTWKRNIPGKPRCVIESIVFCIWDNLGLQVGTDDKLNQRVRFINVYMNFTEDEMNPMILDYPDGRPGKKLPDYLPHRAFTGSFKLDDVEIDSTTKFLEIMARSANRSIHCGLRDCSHPSGPFGEHANIYFRLNGSSVNSSVLEISLSVSD